MVEQRAQVLLKNPECQDKLQLVNEHFRQVELCYLCQLNAVSDTAIRYGARLGNISNTVIQSFGNTFDEPGEYKSTAQLCCGSNYIGLVKPIFRYNVNDRMPAIKRRTFKCFQSAPAVHQKLSKAFPIPSETLAEYGTITEASGSPVRLRVPKSKFEMFTSHNNVPNSNQGAITASARIVRDKTDDTTWEWKTTVTSSSRSQMAHQMARNPENTATQEFFTRKKFVAGETEQYYTCSVFGWVESSNVLYTQDKDAMTYRATSNVNSRLK